MVRKKMEGDNRQRRKRAKEAREQGETPSEAGASTGASKERSRQPDNRRIPHEDRLESKRSGKQQDMSPDPSTGSREESYNTEQS